MIAAELVKQLRRPGARVLLAAVLAVPCVLTLVIGTTQPSAPERVGDWGSVVTNTSGLTLPLIALSAMVLFLLPLAVAVVAGDSVAHDAATGTLRYQLIRPVDRGALLGSKLAVAAALSCAIVAAAAGISLVTAVLAFGWRPLTVVDLEHTTPFAVASTTLPPLDAVAMLLLGCAVVVISLLSTFAFAFGLSTVTRSPFAAAAGGIGLGIVSRAVDNIPGLQSLGSWLPVTDATTTEWSRLFLTPSDASGIGRLAIVQVSYAAVFLGAAWWRFTRADLLV